MIFFLNSGHMLYVSCLLSAHGAMNINLHDVDFYMQTPVRCVHFKNMIVQKINK